MAAYRALTSTASLDTVGLLGMTVAACAFALACSAALLGLTADARKFAFACPTALYRNGPRLRKTAKIKTCFFIVNFSFCCFWPSLISHHEKSFLAVH